MTAIEIVLQTSVCSDCGNDIDQVAEATTADGRVWRNAWFDAVGRGCAGRGVDGEVLPHRPRYATNEAGTARYYFDQPKVEGQS